MLRRTAATIVTLILSSATVYAQTTTFTVAATSANVHKGPSTGSPVIGTAAHGAVLEVTRELGSWVKIAWPKSQDGIGYVHVSTGSIAHRATANARAADSPAAARPAAASDRMPPPVPLSAAPSSATRDRDAAALPRRSAPSGSIAAPPHLLGVGARVGGPGADIGVGARAWSRSRLGLQVQLSRTLGAEFDRWTTLELAPSAMYTWRDRVSDSWWLRPYVVTGPTLDHRAARDSVLPDDPIAGTRFGFQAFGGGEITLPTLPQFAVSADAGYRWREDLAPGISASGVRLVVSGHWYLR